MRAVLLPVREVRVTWAEDVSPVLGNLHHFGRLVGAVFELVVLRAMVSVVHQARDRSS